MTKGSHKRGTFQPNPRKNRNYLYIYSGGRDFDQRAPLGKLAMSEKQKTSAMKGWFIIRKHIIQSETLKVLKYRIPGRYPQNVTNSLL